MQDRTPHLIDLTATTPADELHAIQRDIGEVRALIDLDDTVTARKHLDSLLVRLLSVLGALAVVGAVLFAPQAQGAAQAAVLPTVQPVKVILSGPTAAMSTTVVSTACTTYLGGHIVAVSAPLPGLGQTRVKVASSNAGTPTVKVNATLPARSFVLGRSTWLMRDFGDNRLTPLTVDARQASRFTSTQIVAAMPGYLWVSAHVQHYSAKAGTWVPSQASPVQVQTWSGRQWNTIATLQTDTYGYVYDTTMAVDGPTSYRLVRPDGSTVWSAVSGATMVDSDRTYDY